MVYLGSIATLVVSQSNVIVQVHHSTDTFIWSVAG